MEDVESGGMAPAPTRIAVYDDMLSAPRIVDVEPTEITSYIEQIAAKTYEFAQKQGGTVPYTVIKEVCENFIHADFREPCVSILDRGNTIRFTDQGPGIEDKERAQLPGFTSATSEMRKYIRGVGSGLPTVKEYLRFSNGRLIIEDNIKAGTVVTITVDSSSPTPTPVVYRETRGPESRADAPVDVSDAELGILALAGDFGEIGPTDVHQNLGTAATTAWRQLNRLEEKGLLSTTGSKKRRLTERGMRILNGQG